MSHKAWLKVLCSNATIAYDTVELRLQLDRKSKDAFMDYLGHECCVCKALDKWWKDGSISRAMLPGKLEFHHKKAKLMNIGSFRVTKEGFRRKAEMILILRDVRNCILVCEKHHAELHAH